jgi:sarcosine oxidase subunit alpha
MIPSFRLPSGGRIDRTKAIEFHFNGRPVSAFVGDTVASALLANGVRLVGRSFKYHRPRGILGHGAEEPNALITVDRGNGRMEPNARASVVEVFQDIAVATQNHWPTLDLDLGAVNDRLSPLIAAGFYYKTFMWPRGLWKRLYEPAIRRMAGLGRAPTAPDPERYQHRHAHCEVLVVGAGPAGIAAALAASDNDEARVIICDEQAEPGGSLLHETSAEIDGRPTPRWLAEALQALAARDNVTLLARTTAFGFYNHNHVALIERLTDHLHRPPPGLPRERLWQVRASQVVLATGAHERPLVFADNDRPGVMLAESLRVYVNRYGVAPGRRIAIATRGASAYAAGIDLAAAGLAVTLIDERAESECGAELAEARAKRIEIRNSHVVVQARGGKRISGVDIASIDEFGKLGRLGTIECDCLGMSGGWTPAVHLFCQSRGRLEYDAACDMFVPGASHQAERSAGACNGAFGLAECLNQGFAAGAKAAESGNARSVTASASFTHVKPQRASGPVASRGKAFVDFQNDVTAKDIALALGEGFEAIEHVKRYTTSGMATDQGKTANMNALRLVAAGLGKAVPAVGTTTYRLPYTPVTFGALAGANRDSLFDPIRTTPIHAWAESRGAEFEDVGAWKRAWYFPRGKEDRHAAAARECRAVRHGVGLFDASTLGKIEIVGPDATEFMNRIYTNSWTKLEPGRCRYGLLLKEDGYILDDGVVARLAAHRFHVTTTTGGAARVLAHMEDYLQTEWPELRVYLASITEQWAVIAVQGPHARDVLVPLVEGIDLAAAAFPHMEARTGAICGVPCRLFRVSFTGELGYEINVPADYGLAVWEAVHEAGRRFDITPYGTEAMHVLRAEKGYIIVGQETDGTMTPDDVGLAGLVAKSKPDFVGKRSLARRDLADPDRKQLVGLLTVSAAEVLEEGAQILADPQLAPPIPALGHVTSSYWSASCNRSIALAVIAGGRARIGQRLAATTAGGTTAVTVAPPVFFDPTGKRIYG